MKLTQEQKHHLLVNMSSYDMVKIFETTDIQWLEKQEMELKKDMYGWYELYVNGELTTSYNPIWLEQINLHI